MFVYFVAAVLLTRCWSLQAQLPGFSDARSIRVADSRRKLPCVPRKVPIAALQGLAIAGFPLRHGEPLAGGQFHVAFGAWQPRRLSEFNSKGTLEWVNTEISDLYSR